MTTALFLLYSGFLCFRLFVLWGPGGGATRQGKILLEVIGRLPLVRLVVLVVMPPLLHGHGDARFCSIMERSGEYDACVEKAGCGDCLACERRGQHRAKKEKGPFKALDGELGGTTTALFLLYSGFLCFRLFVLWGAGGGDKMVLECVGCFAPSLPLLSVDLNGGIHGPF